MNEQRVDALFARYVQQVVFSGVRLPVDDLAGGDPELAAALGERIEVFAALDQALGRRPLSLVGSSLGHYRVLQKIGAGGMGEVYRAEDTQLGRAVALKILPPLFALERQRRARFEREARLLAALSHPSVATIYSIERTADLSFLVLELVDGETLAERLARGPIALGEGLPLLRDVASALEAAHARGIVHRDLKPANIKITAEGRAKVLDFGLGKALGVLDLPALTQPVALSLSTVTGIVLGTPSYMSPEQARGRDVDQRTDVWSFGCVAYEALTGRAAFPGETFADVVATVVEREPDWTALPAATPAEVRKLLQQCLEKDPNRRPAEVAAARLALERSLVRPPAKRQWLRPALSVTLLAIGVGAAVLPHRKPSPSPRSSLAGPAPSDVRLSIPPVADPLAYREYLKTAYTRWWASRGPRAGVPRLLYEIVGGTPELFWVIDGFSGAITARVALHLGRSRRVFGPAVTPDGSRSYISIWGPTGRVIPVDNEARAVLPVPGGNGIPVGEAPVRMAFTPDGKRGYVATLAGVTVVDTDPASPTFHSVLAVPDGAAVSVGPRPFGVAVSRDGARAYVSNNNSDSVSVIDTDPASPLFHAVQRVPDGRAIRVGLGPRDLALDPPGVRLYVANERSESISVIDTDPRRASFHTVVATVPLVSGAEQVSPFGVAVSPDGSRVYVPCGVAHELVVIDAASLTVTARIPQGGFKITFSEDGRRGFLLQMETLSVIDTDPTSPTFHQVLDTFITSVNRRP